MKIIRICKLLLLAGLLGAAAPALSQDWAPTSAPVQNWSSVVYSANGSNAAAAVYGGGIYLSANTGIKWTKTSAPSQLWTSIACSADGKKLVAASNPGYIYTSPNSGATWNAATTAPLTTWFSVGSSADGTHLAAVANTDGIFLSNDSGQTWVQATNLPTSLTNLPAVQWFSIASSADGSVLVAAADPGYIITSPDSGQSWTTNDAPLLSWSGVAASADGSHLVAAATLDGVFTSTNSGSNWTRTTAESNSWFAVASSSDGTQLVAASFQGIFLSTNSGALWDQVDSSARAWTSIACSADGSQVAATAFGGIYVPPNSPAATASGSLQGAYEGLFYDTNGIAPQSSGFFTATIRKTGAFSANLLLAGRRFPFTGRFSGAGISSNYVAMPFVPPLTVMLQAGSGAGGLGGFISNDSWTATLFVDRAVFSKTNKPPQAGKKYTFAMSASGNSLAFFDDPSRPGGVGYGTLAVDLAGNVSFVGRLDDGTRLSQRAFVSRLSQWPLYSAPFSGKGVVLGWLSFVNQPKTDMTGSVSWVKPPQAHAKLYPAGFTNETGVLGSLVRATNGLPLLTMSTGRVAVVSASVLQQSFTNHFALNTTNNAFLGENKLNFRAGNTSGSLHGSVKNPDTGKRATFTGVVLQKQNTAVGSFTSPQANGVVIILPAD